MVVSYPVLPPLLPSRAVHWSQDAVIILTFNSLILMFTLGIKAAILDWFLLLKNATRDHLLFLAYIQLTVGGIMASLYSLVRYRNLSILSNRRRNNSHASLPVCIVAAGLICTTTISSSMALYQFSFRSFLVIYTGATVVASFIYQCIIIQSSRLQIDNILGSIYILFTIPFFVVFDATQNDVIGGTKSIGLVIIAVATASQIALRRLYEWIREQSINNDDLGNEATNASFGTVVSVLLGRSPSVSKSVLLGHGYVSIFDPAPDMLSELLLRQWQLGAVAATVIVAISGVFTSGHEFFMDNSNLPSVHDDSFIHKPYTYVIISSMVAYMGIRLLETLVWQYDAIVATSIDSCRCVMALPLLLWWWWSEYNSYMSLVALGLFICGICSSMIVVTKPLLDLSLEGILLLPVGSFDRFRIKELREEDKSRITRWQQLGIPGYGKKVEETV